MFLKQALNVLTILYHLLQARNPPRANAALCAMISHMANSATVDSPLFFTKAKPDDCNCWHRAVPVAADVPGVSRRQCTAARSFLSNSLVPLGLIFARISSERRVSAFGKDTDPIQF